VGCFVGFEMSAVIASHVSGVGGEGEGVAKLSWASLDDRGKILANLLTYEDTPTSFIVK
jgi:hypothetical protein